MLLPKRLLLLLVLVCFVLGGEVNVGLAFDGEPYFQGAQALINSVITSCSTVAQLRFYILSSTHASEVEEWFKQQKYKAQLTVANLANSPVLDRARGLTRYSGTGPRRQHQVPASLYRLFFRDFFPAVKRLIYLDADVVVQMDVARLATVAAIRPIQAIRSANRLHDRLNFCCEGVAKIKAMLNDTKYEHLSLPDESYQEFNNGVMVLDLPSLDGFFEQVLQWLEANADRGFLNNDQHAWNLAGAKMWSPLPKDIAQNAPDGLWDTALEQTDPKDWLQKRLTSLQFIHYGNNPKPWNVREESSLLYDGGIWDSYADKSRQLLTDPLFEVYEASNGLRVPLTYGGSLEPGDEVDQRVDRPVPDRIERMRKCWRVAQVRIASSADHQTLRQIKGLSEDEYFGLKGLGLVGSCYAFMTDKDLENVDELPASILDEIFVQSAPAFSQKQLQVLRLAAEPLEMRKRAKSHIEDLEKNMQARTSNKELAVGVIALLVLGGTFTNLVRKVNIASKGPGTGKKREGRENKKRIKIM
jgi:lipopolysaccharide biosynthesis glycosyltransferase